MTLLGEKLLEALENKNSDINSFLWKGQKTLDNNGQYVQTEVKLINMDHNELSWCYDHCKKMLFNTDPHNLGRYIVLDLIKEQKERCGVELFLRYVEEKHNLKRSGLLHTIDTFLDTNKEVFKSVEPFIKDMFSNIPKEYENLPLLLVKEGCLDKLGVFNKKHITRTFILKQGIWLTPTESKELIEYSVNPSLDKITLIRENLNIKDFEKLYINFKGINYTQMRAMLNIKPNKKYSDLTSVQLETLRNRILFSLEESVKEHISSWENRMEEIELVANYKNIKL